MSRHGVRLLRDVQIAGVTHPAGSVFETDERPAICYGHGAWHLLQIGVDAQWHPMCLSTHGAAGWAPGSRVGADGKMMCGLCGESFPQTGGRY